MKTIIEPFRIKVIEPIHTTDKNDRKVFLRQAHYNTFLLRANQCTIDLLTDSGTNAMSCYQWAALMLGDESYAGSDSWYKFYDVIHNITGFPHIFPVHQGRAVENILATICIKPGDLIINNSHFDTTRANIEYAQGIAIDLLQEKAYQITDDTLFKGDMAVDKLEKLIRENQGRIPYIMLTVTNNVIGGQPISLNNIKAVKSIANQNNIPLILDACRFAENAYFIHEYEPGYQDKTLLEITQEIFSCADAAYVSCKKDGLSNIGAFFACRDEKLAENFKNQLIIREGFPTYGGLAGRDLEAIAVGLQEALDYDYQHYRHATLTYLGDFLQQHQIPHVRPIGGHAVFLDARAFLPHIPQAHYPGIGLANALYVEGGIRCCELGSVMFSNKHGHEEAPPPTFELVRLACPRRVYTQSHFDYLLETITEVWAKKEKISGYKIIYQPPFLRHFSCHFEPINNNHNY